MQHSPRFLKLVSEVKKNVEEIDPASVKAKMDNKENFVLIDVRDESEWQHGHIPGAIHLSKGNIESHIEKQIPDFNTDIVVHCRGGFRGILVAENLQRMGYRNVKNMAGGIRAWKQANFPCGDVLEE